MDTATAFARLFHQNTAYNIFALHPTWHALPWPISEDDMPFRRDVPRQVGLQKCGHGCQETDVGALGYKALPCQSLHSLPVAQQLHMLLASLPDSTSAA